METTFFNQDWCEFNWTSWVPFENPTYNILPSTTGLYRVRAIGRNDIFYIGQTGRNLREQLRDLIRNTMKDQLLMPYNDPHTAAPSLWAWRDAEGLNFECSATPITCSDNERKAIECYLLWQYRLERGRSTVWSEPIFPDTGGSQLPVQSGHGKCTATLADVKPSCSFLAMRLTSASLRGLWFVGLIESKKTAGFC